MLTNLFNIQKAAVVQNYGRSGSLFVESLLDNHANIITMSNLYKE